MGMDEERAKYRVTISVSSAAEENPVALIQEVPLSMDIEEDGRLRGLTLSDEQVRNICTQKCGSDESEYVVTVQFKKLYKQEQYTQYWTVSEKLNYPEFLDLF